MFRKFLITFNNCSPIAVEVSVKARRVTVKGPRGTLTRSFKHLNVEIRMIGKKKLQVVKWFGSRKELACVRTLCSHIENMIKGVIQVSPSRDRLTFMSK